MTRTLLVRTTSFRATHRYERADWTREENIRAFGASMVEPHEHEFHVRLWVEGVVDEETGFAVDLGALDRELQDLVAPLRGADINEVLTDELAGRPSTENLARWVFQHLERGTLGGGRLVKVRVSEGPELAAEVEREST